MKIGVCAKVALDAGARIKITASGVDATGEKLVISDYDEMAVEEAIRTKESQGGEVISFTVGTASDEKVLRAGCLALGVDRAVLVTEPAPDALAVSRLLAAAIKKEGCEIVFTGKATTDDGSSQVGPMVAELLGWAQVSQVTELAVEGDAFRATRNMDAGVRQVVTGSLPVVVTCEDGLNTPRYAKLPDIMKAKRKPLDQVDGAGLGVTGLETNLTYDNYGAPPARPAGRVIEGDAVTAARELVRLLRDEAKVL